MSSSSKAPFVVKIGLALLLVAVFAFPVAASTRAATFITGNPDAVIGPDEVIDDVFITGQRVRIDGIVNGDVFASGQEVIVNGQIFGNLFVAGQLVTENGFLDGSLFAAGYSIDVGPEANVTGTLYTAGFSTRTASGSLIGRSLYGAGYQGVLDGWIARDVMFSGGAFQLNGDVGRDLTVSIGASNGDGDPGDFTAFMPGGVAVVPAGYQLGEGGNSRWGNRYPGR